MSFVLSWQRERYVEPEELIAAIEETGRALSLSFVARSVSADDEEVDDPGGSGVTLLLAGKEEDDLELAIEGPIPIRALASFTGHGLELYQCTVSTDWAPAYLFMLHVATLLGMVPKDRLEDDSDFVSEVRSWVGECVEGEVDEKAGLRVAAKAGAVGPLQLQARREADGPVLEVRGAGTDLSFRLTGGAASLDAHGLERVLASVRGDELESLVAEERARRLATTEPAADPAHGGASVFRVWVDGVAGPARSLAMSDCIDELDLPAHVDAAHVVCDLVHYLPHGQPMARSARLEMPLDEPLDDLWLLPTWCWTPTVTEVQRVFEEFRRNPRARFVPPLPQPDEEGLTLESWLDAFARITGRLGSLRARDLIVADTGAAALLPAGLTPSMPIRVEQISDILAAIEAAITGGHGAWGAHEGLLLSGEWANDSTDDFVDGLVAMLGLPEPPEPAPYDEYLATLNAAAESLGKEEHLYVVPNSVGLTLVIKLHPRTFDELTAKGLLEAHLASGPGVARRGYWRQLASWWSKRFS
ncbi:hypothetical protein [Archangium lansingense]|uniref:Uncharacterized protein n=1 Tax=Archangium lansingense TaxID=2995310 RepID=A0ABT3ZXH9_9BACT|nr:hypothetical protein [Archangium lansinium]MCY1074099.1 hypothetical protein [Archangium lansinium]